MDLLPPTVPELINALDDAFPHRCVGPQDTLEAAHRYAGKRELVDWLIEKLRQTEEEATFSELTDI